MPTIQLRLHDRQATGIAHRRNHLRTDEVRPPALLTAAIISGPMRFGHIRAQRIGDS
jgi:hypothetical protein